MQGATPGDSAENSSKRSERDMILHVQLHNRIRKNKIWKRNDCKNCKNHVVLLASQTLSPAVTVF